MAGYQTKQKRQLMEFLAKRPDQSYTAEELAVALEGEYGAEAPGKSTVYRLVTKLAAERQIKRFEPEGTHCFRYQMAGHNCHEHLHLKCTGCGKLIHMPESTSAQVLREIFNNNGFTVDEEQTVLVGRCDHCRLMKGQA